MNEQGLLKMFGCINSTSKMFTHVLIQRLFPNGRSILKLWNNTGKSVVKKSYFILTVFNYKGFYTSQCLP